MSSAKYSGANALAALLTMIKEKLDTKTDKDGAVTSVNGETGDVTVGPEVVKGEDITPTSVKASCDGNVVAALYQTDDGRGVLALRDKGHPNQDGVQAYALANGGGGLLTRNGDGNTATTLSASAVDMQADAGAVVTFDASGNKRTVLGTNTDGDGALRLIDSDGGGHDLTPEKIDLIGSSTGAVTSVNGETGDVTVGPEVVDGKAISPNSVSTGSNGVYVNGVKAWLRASNNAGQLMLMNSMGVTGILTAEKINLIGSSTGAVTSVNGETGDVTIGPEAVNGEDITPKSVTVSETAELRTTDDGRGNLRLYKADGTLAVNAYANVNSGGEIDLHDASGEAKVQLYANTSGEGALNLLDADGNAATLTKEKIDLIVNPYPVGSIYLSVVDTSPASLFGGTWERIRDTFLLAAGDTYAAGTTGGEATHKLTVSEMPSHTHQFGNYYTMQYSYYSGGKRFVSAEVDDLCDGLQKTGGSGAHNNMPPYLTVYMWKRTA